MSYNLTVGSTERIRATVNNVNLNPLCSYWVGYRFSVSAGTQILQILEGFVALYMSHTSSQKIPLLNDGAEAPQLDDFGQIGKLTLIGPKDSKLVLDQLDYMSAEDVECGNQAMQLHVLKFRAGSQGGNMTQWIDDQGWIYDPVKREEKYRLANDGVNPLWRKTIRFDYGDRDANVIWRRRNATGVRALGVILPLQRNSLARHLLLNANNAFPTIGLKAEDALGKKEHWAADFGAGNIPANSNPRGCAMLCHGAFSNLQIGEVVGPAWTNAMTGNQLPELSRLLMEVVARAAPGGHSLRQLSNTALNAVVEPDPIPAQELFVIAL
jgi:hypothetical protein